MVTKCSGVSKGPPSTWQTEALAILVTAIRNGTTATQNQNGVGLPVTRIETISDGFIDYSKVRHIDVHPQDIELYRLRTGDVLISHINSIKHIGKVARYGGEYPLIHGMNLIRIIFDEQRLDPLFGYYILSSTRAKRYFERRAKKAINQASLNRKDIGAFPVYLPPLPEQRKIAAILSSVDDAIEKTRAVIDQAQVVKRGLMQELLTRGLPGRHTRFKRTETGEIPDDWRVVRIAQIGAVEAGRQRSPRAQGKLRPYLRVANVYDGRIDTTSLFSMPFRESEFLRYKLVSGDLLLNEGQSRELVGRCAQYSGDPHDCCFQNTLIRFRAGKYIHPRFAFWVFRYYFYSGVFSGIARQTTSVAHLGVQRFANLKIALPSLADK